MTPNRRDALAETVVLAVVVVVLGVAAARTNVEPNDADVTRAVERVKMVSPIPHACAPTGSNLDRACMASAPMDSH